MPRQSKESVRFPIIVGNWKMYKTIDEAKDFIKTLSSLLENSQVEVYLAVPFTAISAINDYVRELGVSVVIGAQNMNDATEGAFTGEVAARMLVEAGAKFVILGHSERRRLFCESDEFINKKIKRALKDGLRPILCIGETLEQRDSGQTEAVLKKQIVDSLNDITKEEIKPLIIAYEPVWAIGTGKVANFDDVQFVHSFIREFVAKKWGKRVASNLIIQYGGSVRPEHVKDLLDREDVDGLLVGGASLSPDSFYKIIQGAQK